MYLFSHESEETALVMFSPPFLQGLPDPLVYPGQGTGI